MASQNANKLTSGEMETQAVYGTLRSVHAMTKAAETSGARIIVFWDGASWREKINPAYKANRDDDPEATRNRTSYRQQKPYIVKAFAALGVTQVVTKNLEADDLIAGTVRKAEGKMPMTIITGDKDMWQLVGPNVAWHNPINYKHGAPTVRTLTHEAFPEATQYATPMAFLEGKALRGDASDNLPGVGGIGEKGAIMALDHWGSVKGMIMRLRQEGEDAVPKHLSRYRKKFLAFANDKDAIKRFAENKRMMDLINPIAPEAEGKRVINPAPSKDKLVAICDELGFVSILRNIDQWFENFEGAA
ncbi:MAG: hypothetical protein KI788_03985 [Mameliella sp.]|nr:hypothetical protein [Mameliella sp.]